MSLSVVCPNCLTWIEPHADCCTECGVSVDVDAADADDVTLDMRLGDVLLELGPVRLKRHGWPALGTLLGTTEGLLFVPRLKLRPNGAFESVEEDSPATTSWLAIWLASWNRSTPHALSSTVTLDDSSTQQRPSREILFDSPGALFVQRTTIQRAQIQWGCLRLFRPPSKSITFAPASTGQTIRQLLHPLEENAPWRNLITGL